MKNFTLFAAVLLLSTGAVFAEDNKATTEAAVVTAELAAKASKALRIAKKDIKDQHLCRLLRDLTWATYSPQTITDTRYQLNHLRQLRDNEESFVEQDYKTATLASMRLCGNEVTQSLFKDLTKDLATQVSSAQEYTTCQDARAVLKRKEKEFAQIKNDRENYDKIEAVLNEFSNSIIVSE